MSRRWDYVRAAFMARPFGMPIPLNWFGVAAFGLLGAFLSPGFWLLGAGAELGYLYWLSGNKRFQRVVDAGLDRDDPVDQRYQALHDRLERGDQIRQFKVEQRARDILSTLGGSPLMSAHSENLEQLVWLHLRLLVARHGIHRVIATARDDKQALAMQERQIAERLADADIGVELRRSLVQQQAVIDQRQEAHANAGRRLEHVDSELQRIDQQIALIREQSLLATNSEHLGASLDSLAASFNEASRWLDSQRDLLGALDAPDDHKLPARVLRGGTPPPLLREGE